MAYSLSINAHKLAKELKIDVNDLISIDLRLMGWGEEDAYRISHPASGTNMIKNEAKLFYSSQLFKRVFEERRIMVFGTKLDDSDIRDKTTVVKELNTLASQTKDPKLRTEILMKIADLQQMKKDATEVDEDPVRFYLPISDDELKRLIEEKAKELAKKKVGK